MPIYRITAPNGVTYQTEGPPGATPEQVKAVILRAHPEAAQPRTPPPAAEEPKADIEDTNLAKEVAGALTVGAGQLIAPLGQVYGLVTGDFDTAATRGAQDIIQKGEELKSPGLRAREQAAQARIAAQEGFFGEAGQAIKEYATDPRLLLSGVLQSAPSMLGGLGVGAVARKAVGRAAARKMAEAEAKKLATKAGVAGAIGAGAVQQGASVGEETYRRVAELPEETLAQSPEYQARVARGMSAEEARQEIALSAARKATAAAAAISAGTASLGGLEKTLLGSADEITGGIIKRTLKSAAGEGLQEGAEEGGGQLAQNIAVGAADINADPFAGVGAATGQGAVLGAAFAAPAGALRRGAPPTEIQTEADTRKPLESIDAVIPSIDDPTAMTRERLDILSVPNENGDVDVRRSDGSVVPINIETLEQFRASQGAFRPSDAFNEEMIAGRLQAAAGEKPNMEIAARVSSLNRKLSNDIALGRPDEAAKYIAEAEKRYSRRQRVQAERQFAKEGLSGVENRALAVILEAKSILNDYRVEFAKQQAQPGATVGEMTPPSNATTLAQILERNQRALEEESVIRRELFEGIGSNPDIADKRTAFSNALTERGLEAPTKEELGTLLTRMREESERETEALGEKGTAEARVTALRTQIIDSTTPRSPDRLDARIGKIENELLRAGLEPLTNNEIARIYDLTYARDVFSGKPAAPKVGQAAPSPPPPPPDVTLEPEIEKEVVEPTGAPVDLRAAFAEANRRYPGDDKLATAFYNGAVGQPQDTMFRFAASDEELAAYDAGRAISTSAPSVEAPAVEAPTEPKKRKAKAKAEPTEVVAEAPAVEEPAGPKVTVLPAGVAKGAYPKPRPIMNTQTGRPVEGAAELTPFMLAQQAFTERLATVRNNNLISDRDTAAVLNLLRPPTTIEGLKALPSSLRDKWGEIFQLNEAMEGVAEEVRTLEQVPETETVRAKTTRIKALKAAEARLDTLQKQGDDKLVSIVRYAEGEAKLRTANRQRKLRQIDTDYKAGKITKRERDMQKSQLRVERPIGVVMAEQGITGARTEAAKRFLEAARTGGDARSVLDAVIAEGGPLGAIAERLLTFVPDVRVQVISPDAMRRIAERYNERPITGAPEGLWVPALDTVYLSSDMTLDHTPVHELIHPILAGHIESSTNEGRQIEAIYDMFRELATPEQLEEYGFKDAHEFAAEVWGNEQFRQLIRDITPAATKADPKPRNLLQRMMDVIARIVRKMVSPTADPKGTIDYVEQVMQLTEQAARTPRTGSAEARAIESRLRENPNSPRAGQVGILASLQQTLKSMPKLQSTIARKLYYRYQNAVDYDAQLAKLYGVDKLPDNMSLSNKTELLEAMRSGQQMMLERTFIKPIIRKIAELELDEQDIGMYLWARSAKVRNAMIRERNQAYPEAGSGMSDAEAEAILKDFALRGLESKLKQVAKMHDGLVDYMLNVQVREGLLTRKQARAARDLQPFYTPLKGFAIDGDMQTMGDESAHNAVDYQKNLGIRRAEYTKAGGRKSMPFNPLFMLFSDAKQLQQRASINRVGKQLLDNMMNDPEAHEGIVRYYTEAEPKRRIKPSDNPAYPEGISVGTNMRMERGKYLVVKKDGVPFYIEFDKSDAGQALKRAFDNMTPERLEGFMKTWTIAANKLKSLLTRYSPPYLPRALVRDVMDAVVNAYAAETDKASPAFGKKLGTKVAAYTNELSKTGRLIDFAIVQHLRGAEPRTEEEAHMMLLLEQMIEDGGSPGHSVIHDLELLTEDAQAQLKKLRGMKNKDPVTFAKSVPEALFATLNATAEAIDFKARLATYVAAMEEGIDREGAARLALNSSLNLTRRGEWARYLDTTFFFFSPAAESARRFKRLVLNSSNGRKIILGQMAMGAMLVAWNAMMAGGDDDDDGRPNYMDIPDGVKQTSLVVMTGPGSDDYVAIPLGFMLSFPTYVGQKIAEAGRGMITDEAAAISMVDAAKSIAAGAVTTFSPVRPQGAEAQQLATSLVPNIAKPWADLMVNRNYFDTPIYTESFSDDRAASTLGREDTGRVWKWIARSMNEVTGGVGGAAGGLDFQPEGYRYLFESYAGGLYRTAEDVATAIAEDNTEDKTLAQRLPVVRSYVGKGSEYVPMNQYFKNTEAEYSAPLIVKQPNMDQLVRMEKYEPEDFEAATEKYPLRTDPTIMDAYKEAKSELDKIGRRRRETLLDVDDPDERREIVKSFREEQNEIYKAFNQTYNAIADEYRKE